MAGRTLLERVIELCEKKHISIAALERNCGFGNGTIKKWGNATPSGDRLLRVADFFGESVDYLLKGTRSEHYVNEDTADIAQKIFENKEMRLLFSNAVDSAPEDVMAANAVLLAMKRKERGTID